MGKKDLNKKFSPNLSYERITEDFVYNVDCINFSLPILMSRLLEAFKKTKKDIDDFFASKAKKIRGKRYSIHPQHAEQFESLLAENKKAFLAIRTVPRSLLIALVSYFDSHLRELLRITITLKPEIIASSEKKISTAELLDFNDVNEIKEYVIQKEIDQLMDESRLKCFEWLENKLNTKFDLDPNLLTRFNELTERRNLFVHTDGIVSKQYLNVCQRLKFYKKLPKLGDQLTLTPEYFFKSCRDVYILGLELSQLIWRKVLGNQIEEADTYLINKSADLLSKGNNFVAGRIAEFGSKRLDIYSEKNKLMLLINQSLAMKFGKAKKEAIKLIDFQDWTATENVFKLAASIIKDEFKIASSLMKKIGKDEDMDDNYHSWPLFKEFRTQPIFLTTYEKIFKKPFIIEESGDLHKVNK